MSTRTKKNRRLLQTSRLYLLIPIITLLGSLAISIIFLALFEATRKHVFIVHLLVVLSLAVIAFTVMSILIIKRVHETYYNQIYLNTYNNIKKIRANDTNLDEYKDLSIVEINELNDAMMEIKNKFVGSYLFVKDIDFNKVDLDYIDQEKKIVTYESFKKKLSEIIFLSQSFRNVILEIYYDENIYSLLPDEEERLFQTYYRAFDDYRNRLFIEGEKKRSLLIYLPTVDSFSKIIELIKNCMQDSSVIVRNASGLSNIPARYAIVAYPYSGEEYLLSDLRYAKRQHKVINLFLPNRTQNNIGQNVMMNTSMNINYMNKSIEALSVLDYDSNNEEAVISSLKSVFTDLSNFLDADNAGIIIYDTTVYKYHPYFMTERSTLFKGATMIENPFIEALANVCDDDNSYYFSKRSHANTVLGRALDYYGLEGGYFYIIKDNDNQVKAAIYFFNNKGKEFNINSYLRETLFMVSLRIKHFFEQKEILDYVDLRNSENEYILSLNNQMVFKTDDNFHITYMSNDFKKYHKGAKEGDLCYQSLYGLDKPCHDCPNRTFRKKIVEIHGHKYEASLSLNERKQHNRALYLTRLTADEQKDATLGDLFSKDYLAYSYTSLYNELKDEYTSNGRGYVLLLSVDNCEDFLQSQGSEGYLFAMRSLIRNIKRKLNTKDVYIYNPSTIAIVFPYIGHADVIEKCETIYEISKEHHFDDNSKDQFMISYLPLGYPRGYAYADDFVKHISDFYRSDKYERNKDFITFCDHSITRSASKRDFIVSVIESEFSGHNSTSVNLQPLVNAKTGHIFGAEILLRINDVHRNVMFNAEEISHIAEQENMTHLITDSLINFVGDLYKEYGKSVFKINNFNRIAINIDKTYLNDPNLVSGIIELNEANNIPKNFISFEIPEDIIPDNIDKIKAFINELSNHHIHISVDRYTGEYVGVEKLKELGFNEIKIARNLIFKMDKDPNILNDIKDIIAEAHKVGINAAAVGVENETQYHALKNIDPEMVVQGYYFYKPLGRSELISAIVSYNR